MTPKTKRPDGRGHWPRGKRRSDLSERERETVLATIRGASETESLRSIARKLHVSDRSVRRWLSGDDWPKDRALVRRVKYL